MSTLGLRLSISIVFKISKLSSLARMPPSLERMFGEESSSTFCDLELLRLLLLDKLREYFLILKLF